MSFSRRGIFALFGGTVAAAALPKAEAESIPAPHAYIVPDAIVCLTTSGRVFTVVNPGTPYSDGDAITYIGPGPSKHGR